MRVAKVDIKDLPSGLRAAHAYWESLKNKNVGPAWKEFELIELPAKLLPTTMVIDIHEPLEYSLFRYWGSMLTEIHGVEMTSKCPYDLGSPQFGRQLLADHREIVEKKVPMAWHYSFLTVGGYVHSHSMVRLPLSNDGKNVHYIVVVVDYSPEALQLMKLGREKFNEVTGSILDD
jgi:hypothetical protein